MNIFESMMTDFAEITGRDNMIIEPPDLCFGPARPPRDVGDLANMAREMEVPE